jgi:hypothetical protein
METPMSSMTKHKALSVLACLAVLALPMAAQQEVSPDHFDAKPGATRPHKASVPTHKTSATNQISRAGKVKSKTQASPVLKADSRRNQSRFARLTPTTDVR